MRMWLFITKYKELFIISIPLIVISIFLVILNNSVATYTKTNQKEFNNRIDSLNTIVKNIDKHIESFVVQDNKLNTTIERKEKSTSKIKQKYEKDSTYTVNASDKYLDSVITSELNKRR